MKKQIFLAVLFLCITHCSFVSAAPEWLEKVISFVRNWNEIKEGQLPVPQLQAIAPLARANLVTQVADLIRDAVYQAYPVIKQQVVDYVYSQLEYAKTQVKSGLMIGTGIAVTGVTILIIYKIYDKYLRHEQTEEKTVMEVADEIFVMIHKNKLMFPTLTSEINELTTKSGFPNYLDNEKFFTDACNVAIEKIVKNFPLSEKDKENDKKIDDAMNAIMQEVLSQKIAIPSDEEKLKYIIDHYINNKAKFNIFLYALIGCIEMWTTQFLEGVIPEKYIKDTDEYIKAFKEELLTRLNDEQRAAYSLYLRFKNKVSVEKSLTPEQRVARNPFGPKNYYIKPVIKKDQQVKSSTIIPVKKLSPVNDKGENSEQQLPPLPSNEIKPHERKEIPEEMPREAPPTSASSAAAA